MAVSVNDRLKEIRTTLKLSQRQFCKEIYLSQSFYARIEQGLVKANNRTIQLVMYRYNISKEYLLNGKGDMFNKTPSNVKLQQITEIFTELNDLFQDYILLQIKELLRVQKVQKKTKKEQGKEKP
jgi:transcriptional regulator with XRE-family HTH domain